MICVEPYRPFSSPLVEIFHFREAWQALTSNLVSAGPECPTGFTQVLFGMFPVCLMRGAHPLKEVGDHLSTGASVLFLQTPTTVKVIVRSQSRQLEFIPPKTCQRESDLFVYSFGLSGNALPDQNQVDKVDSTLQSLCEFFKDNMQVSSLAVKIIVETFFVFWGFYLTFFSYAFGFHRKSFHLLKKNSKLLRELKNLDSRQW